MIDLEECLEWLKNGSFKKVCLQIPDDLLVHSIEIVSYLNKNSNALVYVIGDSVYENCCSDLLSAEHIQADACIHFGHACLSCISDVPTFYIFPKGNLDVNLFCQEFYNYFQDETKKILFFYDTLFAYCIEDIYNHLKLKYSNLVISKLNCTSNITFTSPGTDNDYTTTLGRCYKLPADDRLEDYDAVFLGPNNRTLTTLSMSILVNKWHYFDCSNFHKYDISNSLWLKRRSFLIEKIKDAQIFGIIIASINIKDYLKITEMLKWILNKMNKKTYLFSVGKITPTKLANFQEVDIFVAVTCPESSLFDSRDYYKPIVTPFEIELAFNNTRTLSPLHAIDFKQILPGGVHHKEFESPAESDVSLVGGNVRTFSDTVIETDNTTVACKSSGTISNQINTNYLQSRTWSGLEQKLGENNIEAAVKGREGIPVSYRNELS